MRAFAASKPTQQGCDRVHLETLALPWRARTAADRDTSHRAAAPRLERCGKRGDCLRGSLSEWSGRLVASGFSHSHRDRRFRPLENPRLRAGFQDCSAFRRPRGAAPLPVPSKARLDALKSGSLAVWLLLALPVGWPNPSTASAQTATLIRNALVIDGTGSAPRPNAAILIEQGRIVRVADERTVRAPPAARVLDASGKTVIPGIINLRGQAGLARGVPPFEESFTGTQILEHLGTYASYGVTTTTTLGQVGGALREIRDGIDTGRIQSAARVVTPVQAFSRTSGYWARTAGMESLYALVESVEEARQAVDRLSKAGADFIQISETVEGADAPLALTISQAIVQGARRHGLRVAILTPTASRASRLVEAGATFLARSVTDREVDGPFIEKLLAHRTVYAPALSAETIEFEYGDRADWLDDRYLKRSLPPGVAGLLRGPVRMRQALDPDRARRIHRFETARGNLRKLAAAGVSIGLASGSGNPRSLEGYFEYREAVFLKRAGLSNLDVIRAFSSGSAAALGLSHDRGSLEPGKRADLIILNANPLDNIHNLRELHAVFIGGRLAKL